jgi:hypothetical protein
MDEPLSEAPDCNAMGDQDESNRPNEQRLTLVNGNSDAPDLAENGAEDSGYQAIDRTESDNVLLGDEAPDLDVHDDDDEHDDDEHDNDEAVEASADEAQGNESGPPPQTLLEELDARQDDVLDQLDALNDQIKALIADWTRQRQDDHPAEQNDGNASQPHAA